MGTGPVLAMGPAPEFTFLVYAAPVGNLHAVSYISFESILASALPNGEILPNSSIYAITRQGHP